MFAINMLQIKLFIFSVRQIDFFSSSPLGYQIFFLVARIIKQWFYEKEKHWLYFNPYTFRFE